MDQHDASAKPVLLCHRHHHALSKHQRNARLDSDAYLQRVDVTNADDVADYHWQCFVAAKRVGIAYVGTVAKYIEYADVFRNTARVVVTYNVR